MTVTVTAVDVYRQTYDDPLLKWHATAFVEKDVTNDGCTQVMCEDGCLGSGKFEIVAGHIVDCVACKGTGLMWVNLW